MSALQRQYYRVVIQKIGSGREIFFRVIAYGDLRSHGYVDFGSAQALLDALNAAVPEFEGAVHLLNDFRDNGNRIVFSGEMALDSSQLSLLGLK